MLIHLSQVQDIAGFAVDNAKKGEQVQVISKASLISDQVDFYNYTEQILNIFCNYSHLRSSNILNFAFEAPLIFDGILISPFSIK